MYLASLPCKSNKQIKISRRALNQEDVWLRKEKQHVKQLAEKQLVNLHTEKQLVKLLVEKLLAAENTLLQRNCNSSVLVSI